MEQFNTGAYYACHETLEELWIGAPDPGRRLYQGLLQVAAALLHLENGNRAGALSLLRRSVGLLRSFAPEAHGLDIGALVAEAERLRGAVEELGEGRLGELDRTLIPRLQQAGAKPSYQAATGNDR